MTTSAFPLSERILAFEKLGQTLSAVTNVEGANNIESGLKRAVDTFRKEMERASVENSWFTQGNIHSALSSWSSALGGGKPEKWILPYRGLLENQKTTQKVAVIMAGNIPMVGFHDFICTLVAGKYFTGKLSGSDNRLLPAVSALLCQIEPRFAPMILFTDQRLIDFDAVLATGSNNTSRYFEYYFAKYPHIIRSNRNGVAIVSGNETPDEMKALGRDICLYFGLGCRSISKVFLPSGYNPVKLFEAIEPYSDLLFSHFKYMNNYSYQKTLLLMNLLPFLDNGAMLLVEDEGYSSPVSVIHYEFYFSPQRRRLRGQYK